MPLLLTVFLLAGCVPVASPTVVLLPTTLPTKTPPASPQPTPTALPAPSPAPPGWLAEQQMAVIEEAHADLLHLQDLLRYDIDLTIGIESLTLTGRQVTTYTNNSADTLDEIYFNLFPNSSRFGASMEVNSVSVGEDQLDFEYERARTVLSAPLRDPLAPGESLTITLDFSARVPHVQKNYYLVFAMAAGVLSLGDWHPMVAVYDE
ncbi:MAG: hypothetical protein OEV76_11410, partial [Anaerolineae bacterium]|nr:hypothetical protein [Anaerolineae bacterium]